MEGVMHGLYLLWWVDERGLSPAIVAAIMAAGDVALFALEIPTGWVADRFGHRASLLAGSAVQCLGLLACWLGRGVPELVLASLLVALGDALRSGADQALVYRTCVALGRRDDFQRIAARTHAAGLIGLVALTLLGGYVATTWNLSVGWALEVLLCAVGAGLMWMMVEPPHAQDNAAEAARERQAIGTATANVDAARWAAWWRRLGMILPTAVIGAIAGAAAFVAQVEDVATPAAATVLVASITLAEAAGAAMSARCPLIGARIQWLLTGVCAVVALVPWALSVPAATLGAAVALALVAGAVEPLRSAMLQDAAADTARARTASAASACDMACSAIVLALTGVVARRRR